MLKERGCLKYYSRELLILIIVMIFSNNCSAKTVKDYEKRILSENDKVNISYLSDVYGYIRYFYPNDKLDDFDWYKFLVLSVTELEKCQTTEDTEQVLYSLFSPLCPQISFSRTVSAPLKKSSGKQTFYIRENRNEPQGIISEVKYINAYSENFPVPDSLYGFSLSKDLNVSFPIAISTLPDESKELNSLKSKVSNLKLKVFSKPMFLSLLSGGSGVDFIKSPECRIANEIMRCTLIRYFYPYYYEDNLQSVWNEACSLHYVAVAHSSSMEEYYNCVCKLMHQVKDSHVEINFSATMGKLAVYSPSYYLDAGTILSDGKLYVNCSNDSLLPEGSQIIKINDLDVEDVINRKLEYMSYSSLKTALYKLNVSSLFTSFRKDSTIRLTIEDKEHSRDTVSLKINSSSPCNTEHSFIEHLCNDSLVLINLTSTMGSYEKFGEEIPKIKQCKGVIFDMRGYLQPYALSIFANIIDSTITLGNLVQPILYYPDQNKKEYLPVKKWSICPAEADNSEEFAIINEYQPPLKIHINKPFVFLMNQSSISFSETLLEMIKYYKIGHLVGINSAGCNGDVMYIKLPFASFSMTGYKFMNRDFSKHHSIGVVPDIYIENSDNKYRQLEIAKAFIYYSKSTR